MAKMLMLFNMASSRMDNDQELSYWFLSCCIIAQHLSGLLITSVTESGETAKRTRRGRVTTIGIGSPAIVLTVTAITIESAKENVRRTETTNEERSAASARRNAATAVVNHPRHH